MKTLSNKEIFWQKIKTTNAKDFATFQEFLNSIPAYKDEYDDENTTEILSNMLAHPVLKKMLKDSENGIMSKELSKEEQEKEALFLERRFEEAEKESFRLFVKYGGKPENFRFYKNSKAAA